jgi:hypothetical protein
MKKVFSVLYICFLFCSCKKDNTSSSSNVDVKFEITTNATMGNNNVAYYTTALNTIATDNNLSGNSWNKTVKLKRGTPIVLEFWVNFAGLNRTATGSIYINGVLKTTRTVSSIGGLNNTSTAITLLTTVAE